MAPGGSRQPNLRAAVDAYPIGPWTGDAWRSHSRRYAGGDPGGSIKATGRYHRGRDRYPESETWPALYAALAPHVALAEMLRHTRAMPELATKRITRLRVALSAVLDGTGLLSGDPSNTLAIDDLCRPANYAVAHTIADAARARRRSAPNALVHAPRREHPRHLPRSLARRLIHFHSGNRRLRSLHRLEFTGSLNSTS